MFTAARAGRFDVLLVYRVDRVARTLCGLVKVLDDLDNAGVVFRSATEPFDTSTPAGRMMVQMLGVFAEFERTTIIDCITARMERKAARGEWQNGRRPNGYIVDKSTGHLIVNELEAPQVADIFEPLRPQAPWRRSDRNPALRTRAPHTDRQAMEHPRRAHRATQPRLPRRDLLPRRVEHRCLRPVPPTSG
jgi:hypothetical protein